MRSESILVTIELETMMAGRGSGLSESPERVLLRAGALRVVTATLLWPCLVSWVHATPQTRCRKNLVTNNPSKYHNLASHDLVSVQIAFALTRPSCSMMHEMRK